MNQHKLPGTWQTFNCSSTTTCISLKLFTSLPWCSVGRFSFNAVVVCCTSKDILGCPLSWRSVGHHLSKMPLVVLLLLCWSPPSERPCCLLPANLPTVVASGWRNTTWNILTSHPQLSTKGNQSLSHDIPLTSQRYLCTKCRAVWYAEKDKEDQQNSQCNHRSTELPSGIQPPPLHNSVASPSQRKWETMANMY